MESKGVKLTGNDEFNENEIIKRQNEIINTGDAQCAYCGKHLTRKEVYYADSNDINWIFCSSKCAISTYMDKFNAMKDAGIINAGRENDDVDYEMIYNLAHSVNSRRERGKHGVGGQKH